MTPLTNLPVYILRSNTAAILLRNNDLKIKIPEIQAKVNENLLKMIKSGPNCHNL